MAGRPWESATVLQIQDVSVWGGDRDRCYWAANKGGSDWMGGDTRLPYFGPTGLEMPTQLEVEKDMDVTGAQES